VNAVDPLPDGTRLIHIGPQKTGSTALQGALHKARAQLRELGVLYPGPAMRPWEALGAGLGLTTPRGGPKPDISSWNRLLAQLAQPDWRIACISHEGLGRCTAAQVREVIAQLGGERPHVLAVARSYDRLFPSQWQQRIKARRSYSYEEWLRLVLDDTHRGRVWRNVWVPHDTVGLIRRWVEPIGLEHVTLVIGSEQDRHLLPHTCERLLGVPEGLLDLRDERQNRSLTLPEVELLRSLNKLFDEREWSYEDYFDLVSSGVVPTLVKNPAPSGAPAIPTMPDWAMERVIDLSEKRVAALSEIGVNVVGDLDALLVSPQRTPLEPTPADVPIPQEVVLRALEGMARAYIGGNAGVSRRDRVERRAARLQRVEKA
jgi:hypothetical protein